MDIKAPSRLYLNKTLQYPDGFEISAYVEGSQVDVWSSFQTEWVEPNYLEFTFDPANLNWFKGQDIEIKVKRKEKKEEENDSM